MSDYGDLTETQRCAVWLWLRWNSLWAVLRVWWSVRQAPPETLRRALLTAAKDWE